MGFNRSKKGSLGRESRSIMKKIIHYMQEQVEKNEQYTRKSPMEPDDARGIPQLYTSVHRPPSSTYLSPGGKEPQQRVHYQNHAYAQHHHLQTPPKRHDPPFQSQSPPIPTPYPLPPDLVRHQYASDNILQSYTVYIPPPPPPTSGFSDKYFLIFIHGGYYRDPKIGATAFNPTLSLLTHPSSPLNQSDHIAGYASLNYRLSPHPAYPQDPNQTSSYELRQARHPDHIHDVLTAIHDLQRRYGFDSKYILIGHSVGATLALQAALGASVPWSPPEIHGVDGSSDTVNHNSQTLTPSENTNHRLSTSTTQTLVEPTLRITPPTAILALNGIFSFPLLHHTHPEYEPMTRAALFPDSTPPDYARLSPAQYPPDKFSMQVKSLVLASSRSDPLVPWDQVEAMHRVFAETPDCTVADGDGVGDHRQIECRIVELESSSHDESWRSGVEVARIVEDMVFQLVGMETGVGS